MSRFGESINYDPHSIMSTTSLGQTRYKIHRYALPFPFRNLQWLQFSRWSLVLNLSLLTGQTSCYIFGYIFLHAMPPKTSLQILVHLSHSWMETKTTFMSFFQDLNSQII
ncbi:hypothetical protein AAZX31_07G154700 [Glycine max]